MLQPLMRLVCICIVGRCVYRIEGSVLREKERGGAREGRKRGRIVCIFTSKAWLYSYKGIEVMAGKHHQLDQRLDSWMRPIIGNEMHRREHQGINHPPAARPYFTCIYLQSSRNFDLGSSLNTKANDSIVPYHHQGVYIV